jgi:exonuclease V gamma subunit
MWLSFNALCACYDDIKEAIFVAKDGSDLQTIRLQRPGSPKNYLHMLTKWYADLNTPADLNFFPASSLAYAEHLHNKKDHDYGISKAYHQFNGSDYNRGESDSFYVHTLWKGRDPLAESGFTENALKFWNPYLRSISEE